MRRPTLPAALFLATTACGGVTAEKLGEDIR